MELFTDSFSHLFSSLLPLYEPTRVPIELFGTTAFKLLELRFVLKLPLLLEVVLGTFIEPVGIRTSFLLENMLNIEEDEGASVEEEEEEEDDGKAPVDTVSLTRPIPPTPIPDPDPVPTDPFTPLIMGLSATLSHSSLLSLSPVLTPNAKQSYVQDNVLGSRQSWYLERESERVK